MKPEPTIVVGASLAGVRTVQSLRRRGYDEPIVLVGAEPHLPYDRPPLSKGFLVGTMDRDDLTLATEDELRALDVEVRLGVRAEGLDVAAKRLTIGGNRVPFGTLIVATGSTPRSLDLDVPGVRTFRTVEDACALRTAFDGGARVAIIGGGFIGAEIASGARQRGLDVTIIDPAPALMIRGVGEQLGGVLARRHAERGVELRLGRTVDRAEGAGRVERLVLDDGTTVEADIVVVGIGVVPAAEWVLDSGLETQFGLACDETLRAAPSVYAVGDVAAWPSARGRRRAEHWTNAVDQALALSATLTGVPTSFDPLPYVWSDQLGGKLQVWGEVRPDDEVVFLAGEPDSDEFVAVTGRTELHAVVAFGARRAALQAVRLLRSGAAWTPGTGPQVSAGSEAH